jgi:hypothetical protein
MGSVSPLFGFYFTINDLIYSAQVVEKGHCTSPLNHEMRAVILRVVPNNKYRM